MQGDVDRTLDRRTRKRLANRQLISDVATRLFMERGFDQVTVDQIADAADVGRMTVFNHFPRKEDMFFDREGEARDMAFAAIRDRNAETSPVEALRLLAHGLVEKRSSMLPLFGETRRFVATALASEALKARARQMRGEFTHALAAMLADAADRPAHDAEAHLIASLLVATWSVAFAEGHRVMARNNDADAAGRTFLNLIDHGSVAIAVALARTPDVDAPA